MSTEESTDTADGCVYTDKFGRDWRLEFTYGNAKRIKSELKLDFVNAHNGKALEAITSDDDLLCTVLWMLCEEQATEAGVSNQQWADGIDGDTMGKAIVAVEIAVLNFTPPARRPVMKTILDRAAEVAKKSSDLVQQKIRSEKMDRLLERNFKKMDQQLDRELDKIEISGKSDSKSPSS
jgi:hypothetical protein